METKRATIEMPIGIQNFQDFRTPDDELSCLEDMAISPKYESASFPNYLLYGKFPHNQSARIQYTELR